MDKARRSVEDPKLGDKDEKTFMGFGRKPLGKIEFSIELFNGEWER